MTASPMKRGKPSARKRPSGAGERRLSSSADSIDGSIKTFTSYGALPFIVHISAEELTEEVKAAAASLLLLVGGGLISSICHTKPCVSDLIAVEPSTMGIPKSSDHQRAIEGDSAQA